MRVLSRGRCVIVTGALAFACSRTSSPGLPVNGDTPGPGSGGGGSNGGSLQADGGSMQGASAAQKDIAAVDNAVKNFMSTYGVPGVAIAVTKGEKLVYAKAYGQVGPSDTHPVTNDSLFRIASVSKPFTSAGIMRLIEQGKLTMGSTVFGASGILSEYASANLAALTDITIDQLLHHTSGNWPNDGNDPMFQQTSLDAHALIQWTLDNQPDRGMRGQYFYSNFGFCVLGRVIEKLSGKTYEQFIHDEIFSAAGITDMTIAGNTLADRKPNEVIYATTAGDGDPYGMNVARMDSHGGWLASATDLMRFMVRVDGFSAKPDFLKASTETVMTTGSAGNANYACGWAVNASHNWWHTGSLPGTATELIRGANGFNWAILTNKRGPNSSQMGTDIDQLLWPAVTDSSTPWQDIDQF
jgi:CubicO group peptidase (beta-lactamase class C family)